MYCDAVNLFCYGCVVCLSILFDAVNANEYFVLLYIFIDGIIKGYNICVVVVIKGLLINL